MTRQIKPPSPDDLHAFADGALGESEASAVSAHLAAHPDQAADVAAWQRQNEALRALYGPIAQERVPERLSAVLAGRPPRIGLRPLAAVAALVAMVLLGSVGGWLARGWSEAARADAGFVAEAAQAHMVFASEVLHPVEVRANEQAHLQAWLTKRLDRSFVVPDLRKVGLALVGGRLLPGADGAAAQLMYEDDSGRRLTLYMIAAQEGSETAFRYARLSQVETLFWQDETITCALVADLPRERLKVIADEAYRQLS